MKAEIITVGGTSEALDRFLTQELAVYAFEITCRRNVDNADDALRGALCEALSRTDRIVVCSSLTGHAAATVADVLGLPLQPSEDCVRRLEEYAATTGSPVPDESLHTGWLPLGAAPFLNEHGAAPGFALEKYEQTVLLLPVSMGELVPMFQQCAAPYLAEKSGGTLFSQTIGVFGLSEAAVTKRLSDLLADSNPAVTLFSRDGGEILLRITARAADREHARALCEPVTADIRERLGAFVYGLDVGSLQMAVVRLLKEHGMKIATAESCTAGLLSGKLTQVSGASAVFECGIAAYSQEIKHEVLGVSDEIMNREGTVSANTACGMAAGARRVGGSSIGVGITGEAGPTASENKPVGTVFIALADSRRVWVKEIHAAGCDRDTVREIATCQTLDLVRRYLEALPAVMAGGQLLDETAPPEAVIPKAAPTRSQRLLASIFPWKGDSRTAIVAKSLLWVGVLAVAICVWLVLHVYVIAPARNREQYVSLEMLYTQDPTSSGYKAEDFPQGMLARFYALYDQNPDIKGWVKIDGTGISYPVMQNSSLDYSALNFNKEASEYGVPYFDENTALASAASINRSFIIHGNNTGDGQMFSDLLSYTDANFLLQHPTVEMNTIYATGNFEIFAVLYVDETAPSDFNYRTVSFDSNLDFLAFTGELKARSLFDISIALNGDDTLLMLETDASAATGTPGIRLVVAARLLAVGENASEQLVISRNPDARLPDTLTTGTTTSTVSATTPTSAFHSSDEVPDIDLPTTVSTTVSATTQHSTTTPPSSSAGEEDTSAPATTTSTTHSTGTDSSSEAAFYSTLTVKIGSNMATPIRTREELQYAVASAVKTEISSARAMANSTEAQKAQAVASYTYMLYSCRSGGTFSISSSIDLSSATDRKIYDAVGEVLGVKMLDLTKTARADQPLCAMYFSSCNGATASCQNVYTAALPYLQSVVSPYDTDDIIRKYSGGSDTLTSTYATTWTQLKAQLDAYVTAQTGGTVTEVSLETDGNTPLYAKTYDAAGGYVVQTNAYYVYNGRTTYLRGIDIRKIIGSNTLRSHSFNVTYAADTDALTFTVKGHGHGLGLSQYGAIAYANEAGWSYRQILTHYFSLSETGPYQLVDPVWD